MKKTFLFKVLALIFALCFLTCAFSACKEDNTPDCEALTHEFNNNVCEKSSLDTRHFQRGWGLQKVSKQPQNWGCAPSLSQSNHVVLLVKSFKNIFDNFQLFRRSVLL